MESIKDNKNYTKYLIKAKSIKHRLKDLVDQDEIRELSNLADRYRNIFKSKNSAKFKLDQLSDVLLVSTAFMERLTCIKNDLNFLFKEIDVIYGTMHKTVVSQPEFLKLKKNEKDAVLDSELNYFKMLYSSIDKDLKIVNDTLDFHDKLQFNVKSLMKYLIVVMEQKNNEAP